MFFPAWPNVCCRTYNLIYMVIPGKGKCISHGSRHRPSYLKTRVGEKILQDENNNNNNNNNNNSKSAMGADTVAHT